MSEELLPCPFCGSTELLGDFYINRNLHESYAIFCTNCDATLRGYTKSEVIDAWNSRAEPIGNSDELPEWITSYCNERILDLEEWRAEQNHEDLELRERAYYMIKAFKEILSLRKPDVTQ